jgi:hypothetical protein
VEVGEAEQEEYDEEEDKLDKTMKKYTSKMDERMKEFDRKILAERVKQFQNAADPVEVDLFKAVASDIKTPEDFDKAVELAHKNAAQLKKTAEEYQQKYEEEAKQQAARAWGTGPVGSVLPRTKDYEAERDAKIAKGDKRALSDFLMEGFNIPQ